MIHPTAIIDPQAELDPTVTVGPFCVIDAGVQVGPDCWLAPNVYLTGRTTIGRGNKFFTGCVIGEAPQDLKYKGAPSRLRIGDGNRFRENVTVNRATFEDEETVIGSDNLFMAQAHVGHNSVIGDSTIIANGTLFGGHVVVGDRAVISGNCLVHQFIHVGTLAMMQGGAAISKDLPPFCVARGPNTICGLNIIGLRRGGFSPGDRLELRKAYQRVFRWGQPLRQAAEEATKEFTGQPTRLFLDFIRNSKRGICGEIGKGGLDDPEYGD